MPHDSFGFAEYAQNRTEVYIKSSAMAVRIDARSFENFEPRSKSNDLEKVAFSAKRLFDICGAALLLVVFSPLLALIALLIKLTSEGPLIFKQQRPGRDLKPFTMFKFRTMTAASNHEEEELLRMKNGEFAKDADDARITPLGRFLRKSSLDELPQLINVIRGDMSLVGPRPILNCELDCFERRLQQRRFSVRPGITGLWQVSGRSDTDNHRRLMYDLEYIKSWSLILDLRLLLSTIPAVVKCEGAK